LSVVEQLSIVALVENEVLRERVATVADELGYAVVWSPSLRGVIQRIAELRPAVLLVDLGDDESEWEDIVWSLRTNPATRRLAILGFGIDLDDATYERATGLNMEEVFEAQDGGNNQLLTTLGERIQAYTRRTDTELQTLIADAIQEPMPALVHQGLKEFNAGEYYEAHETLEHAWMDEEGPIRDLYRGILQVAVAYYQIRRENYRGALKMFLRSLQWLEPLPDVCQGIDVGKFREDSRKARQQLERLGPGRIVEYDFGLLKPVEYNADFVVKE
jgi:predicted metal-dependent hydrolase